MKELSRKLKILRDHFTQRWARQRTEAVEIYWTRCRKYQEETERVHGRTVQKDLNEPDNYDCVVNHPEPDILELLVKWVLGSTAVNKASGCDVVCSRAIQNPKR